MTLTAHILRSFEQKCYVFAIFHFPLHHTGMNIAGSLKKNHEGIWASLYLEQFLTDNEAKIRSAIKILGFVHYSCFAHNFNFTLAVDSFENVPEIIALFEKGKAVVKHFRFKSHDVSKIQKKLLARPEKSQSREEKKWNMNYDK